MNWDLRSYTQEEFRSAWMSADSIADVARILGMNSTAGGTYRNLKIAAIDLGLNTKHMRRKATGSRRLKRERYKKPLEDILVEDSTYSVSELRKRLIKEGVLEAKCSAPYCPVPSPQINPWTGEETETLLTLDHINGNNFDNRLENLRILCNYCHAHTPTYCGKKNSGARKNLFPRCLNCSKKLSSEKYSLCRECSRETNSKFYGISVESLIEGVETYGYLGYSRILNVSDNAIRKRLRKLGVNPLPVKITIRR